MFNLTNPHEVTKGNESQNINFSSMQKKCNLQINVWNVFLLQGKNQNFKRLDHTFSS